MGCLSSTPTRVPNAGDSSAKVPSVVWRAPCVRSESAPPLGRSCRIAAPASVDSSSGAKRPAGAPENAEFAGSVERDQPPFSSRTGS